MAITPAFRQAASLCIDNTQDPCDVHIIMQAMAPLEGYPVCSISASFTVPAYGGGAGSAFCWGSYYDFQTSIGWAGPVGLTLPEGLKDFNWTDVEFQFQCPNWVLLSGCTDAGGAMSDRLAPVGGGCETQFMHWSYLCRNGQWFDALPTGGFLDDVIIQLW